MVFISASSRFACTIARDGALAAALFRIEPAVRASGQSAPPPQCRTFWLVMPPYPAVDLAVDAHRLAGRV